MQPKAHWENVYAVKLPTEVSWHQKHQLLSLDMIQQTATDKAARIIDVGAGASNLIDDLLDRGYFNLTALDISAAALQASRTRLGVRAAQVAWIETDILQAKLELALYDLWHDRAVFHFLTNEADRRRYVEAAHHALSANGQLIIATFAEDGPQRCSGLDVVRYGALNLEREFARHFKLVEERRENHLTPSGATQRFLYCRFSR